jgi:hypothetical protein
VRRNALLSIGVMGGFVYPWFFGVVVLVGVHFCSDVCNDGYLNVLALLSNLLSKMAMKVHQIRYVWYVVLGILL